MLILESPTKLRITDLSPEKLRELRMHLSYIDKSNDYQIHKLKNAAWRNENTDAEIQRLTEQRKQSLLFEDENGFYTNSGLLLPLVAKGFGSVDVKVEYPAPTPLPWYSKPINEMWPFQREGVERLLQHKHGAVEIATGLGKTFMILHLVRHLGLKTVIMAPSISIAKQILKDFQAHLGTKYVGQFFAGKKESKKRIVVAVAASLANIDVNNPDDEHYINLRCTSVFVVDESHQVAAKTLMEVSLRLMENVPYRFFFSATQLRNDGLELLLQSIIGPVVFTKTLQEGVDEGYLAKPIFTVVELESRVNYKSSDANKMTRKHLLYNPDVIQEAANITNSASEVGKQVLILIDELEQFAHLLPLLKYEAGFAHAASSPEAKSKIPPAYQKSDPSQLVKSFNSGNLPILIGTSCIGCGTDTRNNAFTINLVGGKSEIQTRQGAIGRSTRKSPSVGKEVCHIIDFDVLNIPVVHRHSLERQKIYEQEYGPVSKIRL